MTDVFGVGGRQLLAHLCATDARFHSAYGQRLESLVVLVDAIDGEIVELTDSIARLFREHVGYRTVQQVPGVGPIIAAIFVAEIVTCTASPPPPISRHGAGSPLATASPTPPCAAARSPRWHVGAPGWLGGSAGPKALGAGDGTAQPP